MKGNIIHQHGLKVATRKKSYYHYNPRYIFYEKDKMINLENDLIYNFYCSKCNKNSLNHDNHDNFNYDYMVNPSDSSFIKLQDNFNLGFILLGNEIERENFIYNYFDKEIEKLKNSNSKLKNEKSFLNEKKDQMLKNQNLLEKENSRLSNEIKTLNNNSDKNEKIFQNKINRLNDKIVKKNEELKDFGLKFKSDNNENAFYDIIVNITSIKNLNNEGWIVKYPKKEKSREYYNKAKDDPTIIVV